MSKSSKKSRKRARRKAQKSIKSPVASSARSPVTSPERTVLLAPHFMDVADAEIVDPASDPAIPVAAEVDPALLERSRAHWELGDWAQLSALANRPLEQHPDRAKLALLAGVGLAQTGDMAGARRHVRQAQDWGCPRDLVARVMVAGVHNSLGRAASLHNDEARATGHFEASVATVSPRADVRALGRARNIHEKARLGQLPAAAALMGDEIGSLRAQGALLRGAGIEAHLSRLETAISEIAGPSCPPDTLPTLLARHREGSDARPGMRILVCCHHKAGTNFLLPVFKGVAQEFGLPIWLKFYDTEPAAWRICLHQHARVRDIPEDQSFRGVHMVRHPMGLIYSAMLYHGAECSEPWAHVPLERFTGQTLWAVSNRESYNEIKNPDVPMARKQALMQGAAKPPVPFLDYDSGYAFNGRSYVEMMASQPDEAARLRFEMHAYSQGVIRDMLAFPGDRRFFQIRLEDVSHDTSMAALQQMVAHLGFAGLSAARVLERAAQHCLWNIPKPDHATTGVSDRWRRAFTPTLTDDFRGLFGWVEQALGYD